MQASVQVLESALGRFRGELTVADAAAKSGLPLRDAEEALRRLAADRAGHLSATSKGELIYVFPRGLVRAPETRLLRRAGRAVARFGIGLVRLVVRAWVSVVMVGYALAFLALLIALALRGGDDRDSPAEGIGVVLRVIAEALFWTFHPFSPVFIGSEPRWMHTSPHRNRRIPFYERVNRFVFGPPRSKPDPSEQERNILAEIRRQKGRIAPGDVMRVTGFSREEAERVLLRLLVDYQGDIEVTETGAILHTFAELRSTRSTRGDQAAAPVWTRQADLPPLTGNSAGSNLLFAFINGFNLIASGLVIANGLTLERLAGLFARWGTVDPLPLPPPDGLPLVFGAIPLAFSVALFALPIVRALRRPAEVRRVANENGWRGLLRTVLGTHPGALRAEYTAAELGKAWLAAGGREPTETELRNAVRDLGGEVDVREDGTLVYKFETVAREVEALLAARAAAGADEASPGDVVFSSADPGHGIRDEQTRPTRDNAAGRETNNLAKDRAEKRPEALLLEEQKETLEFLERLMAESKRPRS